MTNTQRNRTAFPFSTLGRALAHRNYRLFFFGQGISLVGTWMQQVAMTWLVYRLTGSAFLLGMVVFSGQISAFVVSPLAGVLTDRWNRHRTLLVTQFLSMIHAILVTLLAATGAITVWQIIVLAVLIGLINAFDIPTRPAFVVDMIEDRADLGNAIALNSSMFHGARLVGPALAGILIATFGEWPCFMLNAISYVAVLLALKAMRVAPRTAGGQSSQLLHGLREGFVYAFGFAPIRTILAMTGMVSLASMPLGVLMPMVAGDILGGGPETYGLLTAASGLGALAGALFLASRKSIVGLGRLTALTAGLLGVATVGVACSRVLELTLLLLTITGFAMMTAMAGSNTILQTIVEEDKRGRVLSLYTMAFMGMAPLGSVLAGSLAGAFGTPWTVALSGFFCIAGALTFALQLPALRASVQPIYMRAGIIPDVPSAIQSATQLTVPPEDCG